MRLMHPVFESPIVFNEEIINILVVENKQLFSQLILELIYQSDNKEGDFILSDDNDIIEISRNIEMITDIFSLDVNIKKNITKLHNKLNKTAMEDDKYPDALEISGKIREFIEKLIDVAQSDIVYNSQINATDILKMAEVKFNNSFDSILEKIINYISVMYEFANSTCFIFVNLKTFFTQNEIEEFYKFVRYNKYNILLVENSVSEYKFGFERVSLIDDDMCII